MYRFAEHRYRVPFDGSFRVADADTTPPPDVADEKTLRKRLKALTRELDDLQRRFYAHDRRALLLIFQGMDAAGKDSTVRAVMRGVNPAGCRVYSFRQPSAEELQHDFLWRTTRRLPERGMFAVFNRSYYEEVLVVRVHPELLEAQRLPKGVPLDELWQERYQSIREHEAHLARNGTVVIKFFLNLSRAEQKRRFLSRLEDPEKHWKFSESDIRERRFWPQYMQAFEAALNATSRTCAPWYAIPADDKPWMRLCVAEIIVERLRQLGADYPQPDGELRKRFDDIRRKLERED